MGSFKARPPTPSQHAGPGPPPPSAPDDTQTHRKGADNAWLAEGRQIAKLKSLVGGLTHRFFTSCAIRERGQELWL